MAANERIVPFPAKIVVLGGLGFIGSYLCRTLVSSGYEVYIFDRPQASEEGIRDILQQVTIVRGDIGQTEMVMSAILDAYCVIYLAHTTVPYSSMQNPVYDVTSNIASAAGWLQHLGETDVQYIIYCSSGGTVYGTPHYIPIDEEHPTDPISSYGIGKLAIEKYVAMYSNLHSVRYSIIRPSNIFGVGQKLHQKQGIIGVIINCALSGQVFEIWGDGKTERDYLYVEDMADAVRSLLDYDGGQRVFNVSTGIGYSVLDIVSMVEKVLGFPFDVVYRPSGGFHVSSNILSPSRIFSEAGWQAKVTLKQGIERTVEWFKGLN